MDTEKKPCLMYLLKLTDFLGVTANKDLFILVLIHFFFLH